MKKKILFPMLVAATIPIQFAEPTHMHIYRTDGTVHSSLLDEQVVMRFLDENLQVKTANVPTLFAVDNVQAIKFGETPQTTNLEALQTNGFCVYATNKTIFAQSSATMQHVKVWNLQGQQVLNKNLVNLQRAEISASHLLNGIYVVQITTAEKTITEKIILK